MRSSTDQALGGVDRRGLASEARDRLQHAISCGILKPGQKINEEAVARELHISRNPLREALVELTARGLVVKVPNRGTFVTSFSLEDVEEICSLRLSLELFALERALRRPEFPEIEPMEALVREMERVIADGDGMWEYTHCDLEFHAALVAAAGHARLFDAWSNLRSQIQAVMVSCHIVSQAFRYEGVEHHLEILEALRARREELARHLLERNLLGNFDYLKAAYRARASAPTTDGSMAPDRSATNETHE